MTWDDARERIAKFPDTSSVRGDSLGICGYLEVSCHEPPDDVFIGSVGMIKLIWGTDGDYRQYIEIGSGLGVSSFMIKENKHTQFKSIYDFIANYECQHDMAGS